MKTRYILAEDYHAYLRVKNRNNFMAATTWIVPNEDEVNKLQECILFLSIGWASWLDPAVIKRIERVRPSVTIEIEHGAIHA